MTTFDTKTVWKKLTGIVLGVLLVLLVGVFLLTLKAKPERIVYGMSFNTLYANELGLNWRVTYDAILNDLGVRNLRLAAHWPMIEPSKDVYNFVELDYQLARAREVDADVVFAIGRRLPRWPECHIPQWAEGLTWEEQKGEIKEQIEKVVLRYKDNPAIKYWQVENEPYLEIFAKAHCGEFDEDFFLEEVAGISVYEMRKAKSLKELVGNDKDFVINFGGGEALLLKGLLGAVSFANKVGFFPKVSESSLQIIHEMTEMSIQAYLKQNKIIFDTVGTTEQAFATFNDTTKSFTLINKEIMEFLMYKYGMKLKT